MSFTSLLLAPNIIRLVWHHVYGSHSSIATKTTLMVLMLGVGCKTVITLALDIGITHMCKKRATRILAPRCSGAWCYSATSSGTIVAKTHQHPVEPRGLPAGPGGPS